MFEFPSLVGHLVMSELTGFYPCFYEPTSCKVKFSTVERLWV